MDALFWFSGTGNSLYAAKKLAAALDNPQLVRMVCYPNAVGGRGSKVGFVFPSYYGNLPRAVRSFIEKLEILPDTYIFAVVTGGGVKTGSIIELKSVLKKKNVILSYGRGLHMSGNYIINYNPADPDRPDIIEKTLKKADRRLLKFAAEISAGVVSVKAIPVTANRLYKNIEALDAAFTVNADCTGCGLCERLCPVANIRVCLDPSQPGNGKPKWLHHCEHCVACISWCPVRAINYGDRTQSRRRYRNPQIRAEELVAEILTV